MEGEVAHHLGRVLRAERGQIYELSDGNRVWLARIEEVKRDRIAFSLVEELPVDRPGLQTALLLSVVKFEAFEWAIEKATELGVSEIVPLAAARSEKALLTAAPKRAERWKKIVFEASQQSRRVRLPTLAPLTRSDAAFPARREGLKILLSERRDARPMRSVLGVPKGNLNFRHPSGVEKNGSKDPPLQDGRSATAEEENGGTAPAFTAVLAIGPEGGWTDAELGAARNQGFQEASLGPLILRTETAVIAALAALNYALGE